MDSNMLNKFKNINTIFQVFATIISVGIVIANVYAASKLAPIVEDIRDLSDRVFAIERDRESVPEWRQKTSILEEKVIQEQDDIKEIKADVKEIRNDIKNLLVK